MADINEMQEVIVEEIIENADASEVTGGHRFGLVELITGGVVVVASALAGLAYKNRDKIKKNKQKKRIAKMKKDGYIVCKELTDGDVIKCVPISDDDF